MAKTLLFIRGCAARAGPATNPVAVLTAPPRSSAATLLALAESPRTPDGTVVPETELPDELSPSAGPASVAA